jgi:hypothetical protein
MPTIPDRLIEILQRSPGLDDEALAREADVGNVQVVNQVCRYLEILGKIHRRLGPEGKMINILIDI